MHGTFIKQYNLQRFWAQTASCSSFELELCGKNCDKQNVHFRFSLAIEGLYLKKCKELLQNIVYLKDSSCQNPAKTSVFGWFALGAGSQESEENTGFQDSF